MYGRTPLFIEENLNSLKLVSDYNDGKRHLRQGRLITLYAGRTTQISGQITAWTPHKFDYPSIIYPTTQLKQALGSQSGKLFAFLGEVPDNPPNVGTFATQSHNGMLVIPMPGEWWIAYDGAVDSFVQCVVYDDTCGAAQHVLEKRGCILREPGAANVLTAAATNIVADDQYRDGVVLQNQGTVDVWIRRGTAAEAPSAVGTGYKVPAGESFPFLGDLAYSGALNGRADGVNALVWVLEVLS